MRQRDLAANKHGTLVSGKMLVERYDVALQGHVGCEPKITSKASSSDAAYPVPKAVWTSTRTQKSSGALRSVVDRVVRHSPSAKGRAVGSRASVPRHGHLDGEKGASAAVGQASASRKWRAQTRIAGGPGGRRRLGLVSVRLLRGRRSSHDPLAACTLQVRAATATSHSPHVAPDRGREPCSRQEAPGAIGVGAKSPP
jgi:hypothetical protein